MTDAHTIAELVKAIFEGFQAHGWLGALAVFLAGFIRVFRGEPVQQALPSKLRWSNWPTWLKIAFPFSLAAGGSVVTTVMTGGFTWPALVSSAIVAGLSILGHHTAKAVSHKAPIGPREMSATGITSSIRDHVPGAAGDG